MQLKVNLSCLKVESKGKNYWNLDIYEIIIVTGTNNYDSDKDLRNETSAITSARAYKVLRNFIYAHLMCVQLYLKFKNGAKPHLYIICSE